MRHENQLYIPYCVTQNKTESKIQYVRLVLRISDRVLRRVQHSKNPILTGSTKRQQFKFETNIFITI